jgi:hypothetical protein
LICAGVVFIISYSSTVHVHISSEHTSTTQRTLQERAVLSAYSSKIVTLSFSGYIFFGTGEKLYDIVSSHMLFVRGDGTATTSLTSHNDTEAEENTSTNICRVVCNNLCAGMDDYISMDDIISVNSFEDRASSAYGDEEQQPLMSSQYTGHEDTRTYIRINTVAKGLVPLSHSSVSVINTRSGARSERVEAYAAEDDFLREESLESPMRTPSSIPTALASEAPFPDIFPLQATAASYASPNKTREIIDTQHIIFDMTNVTGLDSTSIEGCFLPLLAIFREYGISLVYVINNQKIKNILLSQNIICLETDNTFMNLNEALSYCEDIIVQSELEYSRTPEQWNPERNTSSRR